MFRVQANLQLLRLLARIITIETTQIIFLHSSYNYIETSEIEILHWKAMAIPCGAALLHESAKTKTKSFMAELFLSSYK